MATSICRIDFETTHGAVKKHENLLKRYSQHPDDFVDYGSNQNGEGKYEDKDIRCCFHALLFDNHEKVGDTRNEKGYRNETNDDLCSIEKACLLHSEKACCSVVSP